MSGLGEELARALDADADAGAGDPRTLDAIVVRRERRRSRTLRRATVTSVVATLAAVAVAVTGVARPAPSPVASALSIGAPRGSGALPAPTAPRGAARRAVVAAPAAAPGVALGVRGAHGPGAAPPALALSAAGARALAASATPSCGTSACAGAAPRLLFVRRRSGAVVRAFTVAGGGRATGCAPGPTLLAEVSDARAVGELAVARALPPEPVGAALDVVAATVVGARERAPVVVVVAHTVRAVSRVAMRTDGGGADEMAPVDGWVVLVGAEPTGRPLAPGGTAVALTVTGPSGRVVESARIAGEPELALPARCVGSASAGAPRTSAPATTSPGAASPG